MLIHKEVGAFAGVGLVRARDRVIEGDTVQTAATPDSSPKESLPARLHALRSRSPLAAAVVEVEVASEANRDELASIPASYGSDDGLVKARVNTYESVIRDVTLRWVNVTDPEAAEEARTLMSQAPEFYAAREAYGA